MWRWGTVDNLLSESCLSVWNRITFVVIRLAGDRRWDNVINEFTDTPSRIDDITILRTQAMGGWGGGVGGGRATLDLIPRSQQSILVTQNHTYPRRRPGGTRNAGYLSSSATKMIPLELSRWPRADKPQWRR